VELLNLLSVRRSSKGLLREHKPVKCFDAGVLKTIWSPTRKNELCSEHPEMLPKASALKIPPVSLETTADVKFFTHTPITSESEKIIKNISTFGKRMDDLLPWDKYTLLGFVILLLMLAVATFITLVAVHYVTNLKKFRMTEEVSSVWRKSIGKNKYIISREH
jgi:hypothetical protein